MTSDDGQPFVVYAVVAARLMAVCEDGQARAAWEPLEDTWGQFGLELGDFIEQHAHEFFVA